MLCSARELGLSEDHSGLLILDAEAPIGKDIRAALDLDDRKLTIKLTPNRADCLSVVGVAREVAAITGAALTLPSFDADGAADRRSPAGAGRGAGPVRPLLRPRHPRRRCARADAGLDEAATRAQRPAADLRAGRHLQLRDAGTRPSLARVRPRQGAGRADRALGSHGRTGGTAERPDGGGRRRGRRDLRRCGRRGDWPASWAATPPRCRSTRATSTSRPLSGGPTRSVAARAATTSRPTRRTASNAAWISRRRSITSNTSRA